MREDIKERIELIKCGKVPEGYKKTKLGIIPKDWEIVRVEDVLEKVDNPVEVKADAEYTQIGIRSHGKGIFYKEPVIGKELGNKRVFWVEPDCFVVNIVFAWERAVARTTYKDKGMIAYSFLSISTSDNFFSDHFPLKLGNLFFPVTSCSITHSLHSSYNEIKCSCISIFKSIQFIIFTISICLSTGGKII